MIKIHRQSGVTLIEVMVSLTLGVFFLAMALQYLLSGQQTSRSQDSFTCIQENSRFAMQLIREEVRHAGYSEIDPGDEGPIYRGSCGTVNGQVATNCSDDVPATETTQGDRLAVIYDPSDNQDCLGNATPGTLDQIANVFYVSQDADGNSALYCRGFNTNTNNWNANAAGQPLINGIDQMQVQYGLEDENTQGQIARYLNATEVEALDAWGRVRTVRVALLVNAGIDTDFAESDGNDITDKILNENYTNFNVLDSTYTRDGDRKLRRVYESTVAIYNTRGDQ